MHVYARILSGFVVEIIKPAFDDSGSEIQIEDRFTADIVKTLVNVSGVIPAPEAGYIANESAEGWIFAPFVQPVPTTAEIIATNSATRKVLLETASLAMGPLQDAKDLGDISVSEQALLKAWMEYRVAVNRVDLGSTKVTWPVIPDPTYASSVADHASASSS